MEKRRKSRKQSSFCVKFDLVRGNVRLHLIAKRLGGRPSFFIKRSHLSNIRVRSEGVVATAWWVGAWNDPNGFGFDNRLMQCLVSQELFAVGTRNFQNIWNTEIIISKKLCLEISSGTNTFQFWKANCSRDTIDSADVKNYTLWLKIWQCLFINKSASFCNFF